MGAAATGAVAAMGGGERPEVRGSGSFVHKKLTPKRRFEWRERKNVFLMRPGTFGPLDSDSKKGTFGGGGKVCFYVFKLQKLCLSQPPGCHLRDSWWGKNINFFWLKHHLRKNTDVS